MVGIGHNGHVAWGFTSGLSDEDDLYVEKVTGPETYRYKGEERAMDCRDELFTWQHPADRIPPDALMDLIEGGGAGGGATCRHDDRADLPHGARPRAGERRRHRAREALRDLEPRARDDRGHRQLNNAKNMGDIDKAMQNVTWNENVMAADDRGHIGFWHPGLHQLAPKRWDERLPFPGTGKAEWRGLLPRSKTPQVIDPPEGWLANWNNVPSKGWTNGDSEALERATGPLHRVRILRALVGKVAKNPSFGKFTNIVKTSGTTAQQFPFRDKRKFARARKKADANGKAVIDALNAWNGSYDHEDSERHGRPGRCDLGRVQGSDRGRSSRTSSAPAPKSWRGQTGRSHMFDVTRGEAAALLALGPHSYAKAASKTFEALATDFSSANPQTWREPRRMYPVSAQGAADAPDLEFFDRGTWNESIAMGR